MATLDIDKLAKVLAMTTSSHDGEALNAARKANEMVKEAGLTWAQLLSRAPYYEKPAPGPSFWDVQPAPPGQPYQPPPGQYDHYYSNAQSPGNNAFEEMLRAQARARTEQSRRYGERMREEMMRRQAERDGYEVKEPKVDPFEAFSDDDTLWDAQLMRFTLEENGVTHDSVENFMLFFKQHPDLARWLWHHRADDRMTTRMWESVTLYPLKLGPMHLAILKHLFETRR